ncbi:nicotinate-nicotinamide nucleotide adenylyltransferase [Coxiella-like endosymbiont of Rhipicephalus sanguineus]|uniref:nicotinate-nicotinamide nucleotide adenylyltransferase n=1 Tax=Coxiella-like endosymbiont of Rhipicephalus sanguineus TaxID=1955402 RepID=UPI002041D7DA|nr:nicotinate-nicotinamide nucleotide adenylyltransferase [Coxiella-like endosymbiont of Rhipicephalus sanguineus]
MASPKDRLEMIKRAISNRSIFSVNDVEVVRKEISYTIYTLQYLRNSFPDHSLCFILSTAAFVDFNLWHHYAEFLTYCHLIVINRENYYLPTAKWLEILLQHRTEDPDDLAEFLSGKILFQQLHTYPISATEIRGYLAKDNYSAVESMLPKRVLEYIKKYDLYR